MPRRTRWLALLVAALALGAGGCLNELSPQGGWSAPVIAGDAMYVGTADGRVLKVDPATGTLDPQWNFLNGRAVGTIYGTPALGDGTLYGAGYTCRGQNCMGTVFAVDAITGSEKWSFPLETEIVASVVLAGELLLVGTAGIGDEDDSADGYLYALSIGGEGNALDLVKWRVPVGGKVWGAPAVADGVAYFGSMDGILHAVSLADESRFTGDPGQRELWQFRSDSAFASTPLVDGKRIYVGDFGSALYALDSKARERDLVGDTLDPRTEWIFDTGGWMWASPLLDEGVLYAATLSGRVHALDPTSGSALWRKPAEIEGQIVAKPVAFTVGTTRVLAVPSGSDDVWIVGAIDGRDLGKLATNAGVKSSPAVLGGLVYVHSLADELYLFTAANFSSQACINLRSNSPCS